MTPKFNSEQIYYCLAVFTPSGEAEGTTLETEQKSYESLADTLGQDSVLENMGKWEIVWGPGMLISRGYIDFSVYIVKGNLNGHNQYVISIAGTNAGSIWDILADIVVFKQVEWKWGTPPAGEQPKIALGVYGALNAIIGIKPEIETGKNKTIKDFLCDEISHLPTGDTVDVVTVGHSLGGTLASTLALYLQDTKNEWDPREKSTIYTTPTAGFTAGNSDFAKYSDSRIGPNTDRIWNDKDVVPRLWNAQDLESIRTLYSPYINERVVDPIVDILEILANGNDYQQIQESHELNGWIQEFPDDKNPIKIFFEETVYQHMNSYAIILGVYDFLINLVPQNILFKTVPVTDADAEALESKIQRFKRGFLSS